MTSPRFSVVVPTRDRAQMLDECLRRLNTSVGEDDELIVVDSASVDPEVRRVAEDAGALYLRLDVPGVGRARNAGWRSARSPTIAFVDDDVRVAEDWADAIVAVVENHPDVAFFTGRVGVPAGTGPIARPVAVKDEDCPAVLDGSTRGNLGHSANLVVRVGALNDVDGFDESLGAGGRFPSAPEVDLFDRLFAAGHLGRFSPEIEAWHEQWRGKRELLSLDWRYGVGAGARFAKLIRSNRRRFRRASADFFWAWGLRPAGTALRKRDKLGFAAPVVRMIGAAVGFVRAIWVPLARGHFAPRRDQTIRETGARRR